MQIAWNKGLTKETDERVAKQASHFNPNSTWCTGLTKETDERVRRRSERISAYYLYNSCWQLGLTEDTSPSIAKRSIAIREYRRTHPVWNKGLTKRTDDRVLQASINMKIASKNSWANGRIAHMLGKTGAQCAAWKGGISNNPYSIEFNGHMPS